MSARQRERGLHELYREDSELADLQIWGRRPDPLTRRGFLKGSGMAAMAAALGGEIVFAPYMPAGLLPAALAQSQESLRISGKHPGLTVLSDRPLSVETPAHLLDDEVTPVDRLFVRNNGDPPTSTDPSDWRLRIDGEATERPIEISLAELKRDFPIRDLALQLECAGNGRSEYDPPASGNQWTTGAVGCPRWTGVRLSDVLRRAGVLENAVYIGYYGADRHLSGDPELVPISRGVPMSKALEDETLLAWAINGGDLPALHGAPLRLVCPGWPGSASGKWVHRIAVRDRIHDGPKMTGQSYRVPCNPVAPGESVDDADMCIVEALPVKSLITYPRSGAVHELGSVAEVRGHAWAGDSSVEMLDVSIDFGQTWKRCDLQPPANRLSWQRWRAHVEFPSRGYYEVWARATDKAGRTQPMLVPGWNPRGYLNNACHRIATRVV